MILVIDNQGFTTKILTHQLGAVHVCTAAELATLNLQDYSHVVIGHGSQHVDLQFLAAYPRLPVLAIGSAYQDLAAAYDHTTSAPTQPVYGQPVAHHHQATGIFAHLPSPTQLVSYHPWRLVDVDTRRFEVLATDAARAVLAYRITATQHFGLHADPAALQSEAGTQLIKNFLALAPRTETPDTETTSGKVGPDTLEVFTRHVSGTLDTAATFEQLQHGATAAFWLDSAAAHLGQGRYSILGTNRGPLAETVRWDVTTKRLEIANATGTRAVTGDVLTYLHHHRWRPASPPDLPGFAGGWVGYLGYEAKQATMPDHTNAWRSHTPDAYWIRPQAFVVYDHQNADTMLVAYGDAALLDELHAMLHMGDPQAAPIATGASVAGQWRLTARQYQHRVREIQTALHDGTAAGVCLTDTFTRSHDDSDGLALYARLRAHNPAPYGAYLRFHTFGDALEILSASPEKFFSVDAAGTIETKPIKGTVARHADPAVDAAIGQQMAADTKIQSENLMITDLLRDDLATISEPGSVMVPSLMALETFATVHQLVTTVKGVLRHGVSVTEALRAVFPGGSMTGAPRQSSVAMLDRLEAGPRGVYSGAIGWLGDNNTAELSVVIRSIIIDDQQLTIGAGGAVVVDSDPAAENQEKLLKAQALMDTIAEQP